MEISKSDFIFDHHHCCILAIFLVNLNFDSLIPTRKSSGDSGWCSGQVDWTAVRLVSCSLWCSFSVLHLHDTLPIINLEEHGCSIFVCTTLNFVIPS